MKRYETVVIVDPDISEDLRQPVLQRIQEIVDQEKGFLVGMDAWGTKKMAYEINKKPRGYYVCVDYCGTGPTVSEMERFFRIDDRVLKFLTIKLVDDVDLEKVKEEVAKAEAERKEREAQRAADEAAREAAQKAEAERAEAPAPEPSAAEPNAEEAVTEAEAKTEAKTEAAVTEAEAKTEAAEPQEPTQTAETKED
jgi:small subunit ribosomal protein S6